MWLIWWLFHSTNLTSSRKCRVRAGCPLSYLSAGDVVHGQVRQRRQRRDVHADELLQSLLRNLRLALGAVCKYSRCNNRQ